MRIISHGECKNKKCSNCKCVFEYEITDIKQSKNSYKEDVGIIFPKYKTTTYIDEYVFCPDCGEKINIRSYSL